MTVMAAAMCVDDEAASAAAESAGVDKLDLGAAAGGKRRPSLHFLNTLSN